MSSLQLVDYDAQQDDEILNQIEQAIQKEEIKLPAMPDLVTRIQTMFKDEQYDILEIARIIQAEPGLAAYVLKVANSPLHRGPIQIKTAKHAICRLGQTSVQNIVLTYTVRSMFESNSAKLKATLENQWEQSISIASISAVLAEKLGNFDPDQALLAGLLQDIGALPLIDWLKDNSTPDEDIQTTFKNLRTKYAGTIGEKLLQSWQFADEIIGVVKNRENWTRSEGLTIDIVDITTLATHYYYSQHNRSEQLPAVNELGAFAKLPNQELDENGRAQILEELAEEINELKRSLM